jgi:CrcB protein
MKGTALNEDTITTPRPDLPDSAGSGELPIDSDVEVTDGRPSARPRPVHLRWRYVGLVAIGGAVGTGVREALSLAFPAAGAFPATILVINLTGAFLLGVVLESLLNLGADEGRRRMLRLLIGTGFMGGYTTYSTLAVGVAQTFLAGQPWVGILYGALTVVCGAAASFAGIAVGAEIQRWRAHPGRRPR